MKSIDQIREEYYQRNPRLTLEEMLSPAFPNLSEMTLGEFDNQMINDDYLAQFVPPLVVTPETVQEILGIPVDTE